MVSIGPNSQSYNFTHMYNSVDLRGCLPKKVNCKNSISDIINSNLNFTIFKHILHISGLEDFLSDKQANFTLFVPSDKYLSCIPKEVFMNMDRSVARHIIRSHTIDRKIPSEILQDSPAFYLTTKDTPNRLYITNISGETYINNNIKVLEMNIIASNGIIHFIDNIFWPEII